MAKKTWHYAENQFENATDESKKKMNILSADHLAKLEAEQADPVINQLMTQFAPVREAYADSYSSWLQARGIAKGATQRMDELEDELQTIKVPEWDNRIKTEVGEKSADYTTILPNGRGAFRTGRDQVISEVQALGERLAGFASLADVKTEVDAFGEQMNKIRDLQQQNEGTLKNTSDVLEEQRIITAVAMYGNLGALMNLFKETPENIERFFELQIIQQSSTKDDDGEEEVEAILPTGI